MSFRRKSRSSRHELLLSNAGVGELLERDYWAVVRDCRVRPSELMDAVRRRFAEFAPSELAVFRRTRSEQAPLSLGDEMEVGIAGAGSSFVRVLHRDAQSLTLATLVGHPEAGRITFGAYRNPYGDVIFHIRSRARSGSRLTHAGFRAFGEAMQTNTWTDFVAAVAHTFGAGVIGFIHAEQRRASDQEDDGPGHCSPTFRAEGDDAGAP